MNRNRAYLLGGAFGVVLAGACASGPDSGINSLASDSQSIVSKGVNATLAVTSDWGAGYCASVILSNAGSSAVTTWQVVVNAGASTISQLWEGTDTKSGNLYTVSPESYDAVIPAGGSASFGFCGKWCRPADAFVRRNYRRFGRFEQ